ncbi:MAG: 23S rRNA (uracil(1939)-C(5))-methyltransferase RlmD [Pseudomonadota bacterium]
MKKPFTVEIEKMVYGGRGMGRVNGKVVFVPFTAPGDQVQLEVLREKRDYIEAVIKTIEQNSPWRVKPFCDLFGKCGGCHYQHLPYLEQLKLKGEILEESLRPLTKEGGWARMPVFPSPGDRGYRIRAQLQGGWSDGQEVLGFYGWKTRCLVEVRECPLLHPLANKIFQALRRWMDRKREIFVQKAEIQVSPDEEKGVIRLKVEGRCNLQMAARFGGEFPVLKGVIIEGREKISWGDSILSYHWPKILGKEPLHIRASYDSFSQVNPDQNWNLMKVVVEWAELTGQEKVVDLYCGSGNLTLPLAQRAMKVWGVDRDRRAIEMAGENARENKLDNCAFIAAGAEAGIKRIMKEAGSVECIVLDPPRAGAKKEVLNALTLLCPQKIFYVSCEPPTLIRDLVRLQELGYNVNRIQPLDMFPQTYHVEVIAELIKK